MTINLRFVLRVVAFPSPYGEVGFDQYNKDKDKGTTDRGFRPLTGKLVLINKNDVWNQVQINLFPSPYGEVGFDQAEESDVTAFIVVEFPSPYGEVGFDLQIHDGTCKHPMQSRFRPLTGKLVLIY